jgi:Zn-dependent protease
LVADTPALGRIAAGASMQDLIPVDGSVLGNQLAAMRCWAQAPSVTAGLASAVCEWRHPGSTGVLVRLSGNGVADVQSLAAVRDTVLVTDDARYKPAAAGAMLLVELLGLAMVILASLVLHEVGHAVAAYAVRFRVLGMVLGAGPTLWSGHIAGLPLTIRVLPIGGHVMTQSTRPGADHLARMLIWSAGPGANAIVAAFAFTGVIPTSGPGQWVVIINALLCVTNLVPYSKFIPEAGRRVGTDGWQIVHAVRARHASPAADGSMAPIW